MAKNNINDGTDKESENPQKGKTFGERAGDVALNNVGSAIRTAFGVYRTVQAGNNIPPMLMPLTDNRGVVSKPGFTPNDAYNTVFTSLISPFSFGEMPSWYGNLLNSHIDSLKNNQFLKNYKRKTTEDRFKTTRKSILHYNDFKLDYFKHQFYIDGLTPLLTSKNLRYANDGSNIRSKLISYKGTGYENEDPVYYGFEVIIDSITSPLLNGSVESFIDNYPRVNEIQARRQIIYDFKKQFEKIFKTNAKIYFDPDAPTIDDKEIDLISKTDRNYVDNKSKDFKSFTYLERNRKAYLAHYLLKLTGLDALKSNRSTNDKITQFINYPTDKLTLSFSEDVSGTLSTLGYLYNLLYWSVPNGKNIIPENLLRFNCVIVVSEVRNFKRVVRTGDSSDAPTLEVVKDNVSKYIYTLNECQFFFSKYAHDDSIDISNIKMFGEGGAGYDVDMSFKYSTLRFEKWIPGSDGYGKYAGYNNGALWRAGNKGSSGLDYLPVPKFYTTNTNTNKDNGVLKPTIFEKYPISGLTEYLEPEEESQNNLGLGNVVKEKMEETNNDDESKDNEKKKTKKTTVEDDNDDNSWIGQIGLSALNVGLGFVKNEVGAILSDVNQKLVNQRKKILMKFSKYYKWEKLSGGIGENESFIYTGPKYSKKDKSITETVKASLTSGANIKEEVKEYFGAGESYLLNQANSNSKNINDVVVENSTFKSPESFTENINGLNSIKGLNYNKSAVEHGLNTLSYQFGLGQSDPQKYPNPVKSTTNLNILVKNNSSVLINNESNSQTSPEVDKTKIKYNKNNDSVNSSIQYGLAMLRYQFPNSANKYPIDVTLGSKNLNDLVRDNSEITKDLPSTINSDSLKDKVYNKSAVEHGLSMLRYQFPNSANKYPIDVTLGSKNLNDVVKDNSSVLKEITVNNDLKSLKDKTYNKSAVEHGLAMLRYQFPSEAGKYPSPVTTGSKNLNDIVKDKSIALKEITVDNDLKSLKDKTYNKSAVEYGLAMLRYQFPSEAGKYPSPIITGSKNLNDIVVDKSTFKSSEDFNKKIKGLDDIKDLKYNKSAVEHGLNTLSYQFGIGQSDPQKYPNPVKSTTTLNDIVKDNSSALKEITVDNDLKSLKDLTYNKSAVEYGLAMLRYQFPSEAGKYPSPVITGVKKLNDVVKEKSSNIKATTNPPPRTLNDIVKNNTLYNDITKVKFGRDKK